MQMLLLVLDPCSVIIWGVLSFIFQVVSITISHWKLWSRIFVLDENNRIKLQGSGKLLSYSSRAAHIQTPCWWFYCLKENILLLPQACLLALYHLQVMIKLRQRLLFNLIGHCLQPGLSTLLSSHLG